MKALIIFGCVLGALLMGPSCKQHRPISSIANAVPETPCKSVIAAGGQLSSADQKICSPNQNFEAVMQSDGNFVVYSLSYNSKQALWSSQSNNGARLILQADCNLVVYGAGDEVAWNSGTAGRAVECRAEMQDDGNFVLYNSDNVALWASKQGDLSAVLDKNLSIEQQNTAEEEFCACIKNFVPNKILSNKCLEAEFKTEADIPAALPSWLTDRIKQAQELKLTKWGPLKNAINLMRGLECGARSVNMMQKFMKEQALEKPESVKACIGNEGEISWPSNVTQLNRTQRDVLERICSFIEDNDKRHHLRSCSSSCSVQFDAMLEWGQRPIRQCVQKCEEWCSMVLIKTDACRVLEVFRKS